MADSEAVNTAQILVEGEQASEEVTVTTTEGQTEPEQVQTKPGKHTRAGFTTNKGHGESKQRRKMANKSRRINRHRQ